MTILIIIIATIIIFFLWNLIKMNTTKTDTNRRIEQEKVQEESEIVKIEKHLLKHPNDIPSLFILSKLYFEKNKYKEAKDNLDILLAQNLSDMHNLQIEALILASDSCLKLGDPNLAEIHTLEAFKIDETNIETLIRMVKYKYDKGDFDTTISLAKNIITLDPERFDGHYYFGLGNYQKSILDIALKSLKEALLVRLNDFTATFTVGKIYEKMNDTSNALTYFNNTFTMTKDNNEYAEALYHKGLLLNKINESEEAKDNLLLALKKTSEKQIKLLVLKLLIEIEKKTNDICQIVFCLKDYLAIMPDDQNYLNELQYYIELKANTMFQKFEITCEEDLLEFCLELVKVMRPVLEIVHYAIKEDQSIEIIITTTKDDSNNYKEVIWFMRNHDPIGVIPLMDIYSRMKEESAKECTIVCNSTFNEEAKKFSQPRMLNLVEKQGLIKLLDKRVDKIRASEKTIKERLH